jgi:hypothetical protein
MWVALSYVLLSVICGIALAWGGMAAILGTRAQ